MQEKINDYFNKLCDGNFFANDDEEIIGKADCVIAKLKKELKYMKDPDNEFDEEEIEFYENETKELISEIKQKHAPNDAIKIRVCAMANFYILCDNEELLEDLKEYYNEERKEDED